MRVLRVAGVLALAAALMAGATACTGQSAPPATSTPAADPPAPSPSPSASPEITPAKGEVLKVPALSLHLLEDVRWLFDSLGTHTAAATALLPDGYPVTVRVSDVIAVQTDLDAYADAFIAVTAPGMSPKRIDDRLVAGVRSWAVEGSDDLLRNYWTGGIHNGRQWTVQVETPLTFDEADAVLLREQVIASIVFS